MMKVAVFLDYANVDASSRRMNCNIDYGALLDYLADETEERTLQTAYAYVPIDPRQEHAMDERIRDLWQAGYIVQSKVGNIAGESYKCDFDVEMTLDISRIAYTNAPDIVVLVSGDSDFIPIVLDLRGRGIRVEVAAFNVAMSAQLALKSSGFISLDALLDSDFPATEEFAEEEPEEDFDADAELNQRLQEADRDRRSFETSDDVDEREIRALSERRERLD